MAPKASRMDDVKRPDRVTPETTARPIVVTNRPTLTNDPMMTPSATEEQAEGTSDVPMNHSAKTIKPLGDAPEEAVQPGEPKPSEKPAADPPETAGQPESKPATVRPPAPPLPSETSSSDTADEGEGSRDTDASISAEEVAAAEAKAKRDDELEQLIASEKYTVPINAVQRRRSRTNTIILSLLAVLLAVALADVVTDVGLVKPPSSVPHTHFFSGH